MGWLVVYVYTTLLYCSVLCGASKVAQLVWTVVFLFAWVCFCVTL